MFPQIYRMIEKYQRKDKSLVAKLNAQKTILNRFVEG